jgi:hypothetical protein
LVHDVIPAQVYQRQRAEDIDEDVEISPALKQAA